MFMTRVTRTVVIATLIGAAGCAAARPARLIDFSRAPAGVRVTSHLSEYVITGDTPAELRAGINRLGPVIDGRTRAGSAHWHIRWNWSSEDRGGTCAMRDVRVHLDLSVRLPRWEPGESAEHATRLWWERFHRDLVAHEQGHVDIAIAAAREIHDGIRAVRGACGSLGLRADGVGARILRELRERQEAHDDPSRRRRVATVAVRETIPAATLRLHEFSSRVFGNTRMLRILLPPGYDAPENAGRRYPVLFLNDGQNLFDRSTATFGTGEWRVDETVSAMTHSRTVDPMIVVGIDNAGRRERFREYFPWPDEFLDPPMPDVRGRDYPQFLIDEVLPFVDSIYRISPRSSDRGIGGSSAGALAAMYAVVTRPGVFGRLLVESPSIYVDSARVLKLAGDVATWPDRIYLGAGTNERNSATCNPAAPALDDEVAQAITAFEELLLRSGVSRGRIMKLVVPCARHAESAWAARLPRALAFLFGGAP